MVEVSLLLLLLFLVLLLLLLIGDRQRETMGTISLMEMLLLLPVSSSSRSPLPPPEKDMMHLKVHHLLGMLLLLLLHLSLDLHLFQCLLEFRLDACSSCISSRLGIHPFRRRSLRDNTECVLSRDTLDICALDSGGAEVQCTSHLNSTCLWHGHVCSSCLPLLFTMGFGRLRFKEGFFIFMKFCQLPQKA
jgi:hypothetical protein